MNEMEIRSDYFDELVIEIQVFFFFTCFTVRFHGKFTFVFLIDCQNIKKPGQKKIVSQFYTNFSDLRKTKLAGCPSTFPLRSS